MGLSIEEIWKDVPDYEGVYQVSNLGRVKRLNYRNSDNEFIMAATAWGKDYLRGKPYLHILLSKDKKQKHWKVHRLVLNAFIGKQDHLQIDHINGITDDNRLENLRYTTNRQNKTLANSKRTDKSSKYVGVQKVPGKEKWFAKIRIGDKRPELGVFNTEEEAHNAYQAKLKEIGEISLLYND